MPMVRPAFSRLIAILLAALVVISGATIGFALPAIADEPEGPKLTIDQKDGLDPAGASITITGTNYEAVEVAKYGPPELVGEKGGFYVQIGYIDPVWKPSDPAKPGSSTRTNAYQRWVQGTLDADYDETGEYMLWTDNGDGTADFEWTITIDKATLSSLVRPGAQLAVFTTGAGGVKQPANELAVPLTFAAEPALNVSATEDLDPSGAEITITGTNYEATALGLYGPLQGKKAGVYVQVGYIDPVWKPSDPAKPGTATRSNAYQRWVQGTLEEGEYALWTDNGDGTADFSITLTIDKLALNPKARAGAQLAVFTSGAGGPKQPANELAVPISFDTEPKLVISQSEGLDPNGAAVTVRGYNYESTILAPSYYKLPEGAKVGFYAQIGYLNATWRPSESSASDIRSNAYSAWVQGSNSASPYLMWSQNAANGEDLADFSWTVTIDKDTVDAKWREGAQFAAFTVGAGSAPQATNELAVPLSWGEGALTTAAPTIGGDVHYLGTATAVTDGWTNGTEFTYQWLADSEAIPGATSESYEVSSAALIGKKLSVRVTGSKSGWASETMTSAQKTVAAAPLVSATPTITGTAKVGSTLTAKVDATKWTASTKFAYQWYAAGKAISGATKSTLVLKADQLGKAITVKVTGSRTNYVTTSKTSKATATVAAGTLKSTTPTVSGTMKVGQKLAAVRGTWTPGASIKYQWLADGKSISGATGSTFTVQAAQLGKRITVKVTGSLAGYTTVSKTSSTTSKSKIAAGTLKAATPTISGTVKVGKTITAVTGTWTSGTKFSYQWYANGKKIAGATSAKYKIKSGDKGKLVTVKVTGTKAGYTTVTKTSDGKKVK